MRIHLSILACCVINLQGDVFSQPVMEGSIQYKQTRYFEFENMPADMPKSQESFMRLLFTKDASLYEKDPEIKEEVNPNDNTPRMWRRMRGRDNRTYYKALADSRMLEQVNLFGKDFLVLDSIHQIRWKISAGEQKTILGYTCMKATFRDSTQNLVAFFTPQIPLKWGPDRYGNLPGTILELQSAQVHIIATSVQPKPVTVSRPEKGDEMTRKEFEQLREQKMKEQKEMWGGRGGGEVRIIRN